MRATNAPARKKYHKKILDRSAGFRGAAHRSYKFGLQMVMRAERQAFIGRKLKKRDYRSLWITRTNIAARAQGISYSRLIAGLNKADIRLDRKQLSELAINAPEAFAAVVARAKAALGIA